MGTKADRLLWPEEAAALLGVAMTTFKAMHTRARRAAEDGTTRAAHLPLPVGKARREVPRRHGHPITVDSPQWSERDLLAFQANRPGSPGRPRKEG